MTHVFNLNSVEAESGKSLEVQDQSRMHSESLEKKPKIKQTKKPTTGTGEVALQIRVLTATVLEKDTHLVPSTHIGGGSSLQPITSVLASLGTCTHMQIPMYRF